MITETQIIDACVTAGAILPGKYNQHRIKISDLCDEVCRKRGLTRAELMARTHKYRISHARHEVMYLASKVGKSTPQIGRFFGFDHTTVLHGIRSHERRLNENS